MKPDREDLFWMAAGAGALLVVTLIVLALHHPRDTTGELAAKAQRVDAVEQMRLGLASAAEAEKSAVLAVTDEDSQTYADQARAATAQVERERVALTASLQKSGTPEERDLLARFGQAFAAFQKVDAELLALAVKNTNLKAYSLAFGPAADAVREMDSALSRLVSSDANAPNTQRVALLAFGAQAAVLRLQATLAPHIAEESDAKMDALEAQMEGYDLDVRKDLDGLSALEPPEGNPDLQVAISSYARFNELRTRILALSRENTNVRSLALSLSEKRKVSLQCQDLLSRLQQAILAEPIPGVSYGAPESPR